MIRAIVIVDKNWAIGSNGELLANLPKDLKRFKKLTLNNYLIMGRKTLDSLPGGNPLTGRKTIILTRDENYKRKDVAVAHSIDSVLDAIDYRPYNEDDIDFFVCGGGEVYHQMLPYVDEVLVTKINFEFQGVDTYFPELSEKEWKLVSEEKGIEDNGFITDYLLYERRN